jgi:hypothetical protein
LGAALNRCFLFNSKFMTQNSKLLFLKGFTRCASQDGYGRLRAHCISTLSPDRFTECA